ncbi:MAG: hypothetical protein L0G55_08895 [Corynebacterium sp.]|uniref:hypothetical protein n=1 Tax=Corynebacterium sp. TaxID=1720 RepID=UPI00265352CF|nr:hypothetical protein [Corynebacterium sp.]MDN6509448.1 hypothetical protein [Corynebacterium sp.]
MVAAPLDTLTVMQDLDQLRDLADENWDALSSAGQAEAFLAQTAELDTVSLRIGELSVDDPRLRSVRDLAFARCVAAQACQLGDELEAAASLLAALSLSAGDPVMLATARLHLAESALLQGRREDAENLALSVRMAEGEIDATPVAGGLLERIRRPEPEPEPEPEVVLPQTVTASVTWDDRVRELAAEPFTEDNDARWDELLGECRYSLETADSTGDLSALRHRLGELMDVIAGSPSLESPHLRPEVITRAVGVHRLQQAVMEALGDSIRARQDRNRFFETVLSRVNRELPSSVPLDDRILVTRLHLNLSAEVTGHDPEARSGYASQLAELYQRKNDHNGEIMAFLEKGACLEKLGRLADMYDVYEQSLNLSRRYGLTSGVIWSTIRLSYAHFLAKDPRTATQLLLDMDERLTEDEVSGVDEREAYAEAKVALANLFAHAGAQDGSQRFYGEAADIFDSIGNDGRAWECRQKSLQ